MGLDMYLTKKTYVKNWSYMKDEDKWSVTVTRGGKPAELIKPERIREIEEEVCYWRKANAIHQWFVNNVQDGEDDCETYHVSEEKLRELTDLCSKVLTSTQLIDGIVTNGYTSLGAEPGRMIPVLEKGQVIDDASIAESLLPTARGFFFGSTDYDQYYIEDLKHTKETLEAILAEDNADASFYYHSSW
jgi:hypothetical protein